MTRSGRTARLRLDPLTVEDADDMTVVLGDPALYAFIGGVPPTRDELRGRYERQVVGRSPDGAQLWHNWIVRTASDGTAIGYVQATVTGDRADVAWLIGTAWQGRGYAREAAAAMCDTLVADGVRTLIAHVHPDHTASAAIAAALGLTRTGRLVDGEDEWCRRVP